MGIKRAFLIFLFASFSLGLFGQDGYVRHTVLKGETVYSIATKYQISEADLVKFNPDIAQGLKEGTVLILPKNARAAEEKKQTGDDFIYHTVEAKETIYGLCKKYNITEAQLLAANPDVKDGLKVGSTIVIPKTKPTNQEVVEVKSEDFRYYVVELKETVYSICKAAGITEALFLELNPEVREKGLQIGQTVRLPKNTVKEEVPSDQPKTKDFGLYRVLEGDDLAAIAAKYATTVEELLKLNPELVDGLVVGKYIVVPAKKSKPSTFVSNPTLQNNLFWNVPSADEKPNLHFAVALPLYLSENDSIDVATNGQNAKVFEKSVTSVQFLAGFLTAMDTLAGLGYEIKIDIYDTKNDLDVVRSIARKIDRSVDAIIGPLYAKNAELMASMLTDIPVVSPLSKTLENADKPNLINCVANQQSEYLAMTSMIQSLPNSKIVFVNGNKKANREAVKWVKSALSAEDTLRVKTIWTDGGFSVERHLKPYQEKGKNTVIIVVDQNAAFVSDLFTKLKNFRDSSVLIVTTSKVFEINTLENRYLNNQNFVGLNTDYVNYADTTTQLFIKKFRAKTATEPNKYGYSGYDTGLYFAQLLAAYGKIPPLADWPKVRGTNKGFYFIGPSGSGAKNNFIYQLQIRDFELLERKQ